MTSYSYVTVDCPETGRPITVARNTRDDPVGHLYVSGRISQHQRAAAEAYQHDCEAMAGGLRAASTGPGDIAGWRSRRPHQNSLRKHRGRLDKAHAALGPDRSRLIRAVLIDSQPLPRNGVRELQQALDKLAEVYGLATPTRH
jgi:hypothetical protein